jgi:integrase
MPLKRFTRLGQSKRPASFIPWQDLPVIMTALRQRVELKPENTASAAMQLLILTWQRAGEILNVEWPDIDFEQKTMKLRGELSKCRKDVVLPLSDQAIDVFKALQRHPDATYVFTKTNEPQKRMTINSLIQICQAVSGKSPHSFRSTARKWAVDRKYPETAIEIQLTHIDGPQVREAFETENQLLAPRREMMQAWADRLGPITINH